MRLNLLAFALFAAAACAFSAQSIFTSGEWQFSLEKNISAADAGGIFSSLSFSDAASQNGWSISSSRDDIMFFSGSSISKSALICESASASCEQSVDVYLRHGSGMEKAGTLSHSKKIEFDAQPQKEAEKGANGGGQAQSPFAALPPYWPAAASVLIVVALTGYYLFNRGGA